MAQVGKKQAEKNQVGENQPDDLEKEKYSFSLEEMFPPGENPEQEKAGQNQPQVIIPIREGKLNRMRTGRKIKRPNGVGKQAYGEHNPVGYGKNQQGNEKGERYAAGRDHPGTPPGAFSSKRFHVHIISGGISWEDSLTINIVFYYARIFLSSKLNLST